MQFKIKLKANERNSIIPINYQYPLSAAFYKIIAKGNEDYADFLHNKGYGRGFKFFTFSDINCPFEIKGDRLRLKQDEVTLQVCFHIPKAMESFINTTFNRTILELKYQYNDHRCSKFRTFNRTILELKQEWGPKRANRIKLLIEL